MACANLLVWFLISAFIYYIGDVLYTYCASGGRGKSEFELEGVEARSVSRLIIRTRLVEFRYK